MGVIGKKILASCLAFFMVASVITIIAPVELAVAANPGTLYVGGTGGGNYSSIQSAINAASNGDTIFVYSGTYNENLIVNRQLTLVGEDKFTTIIDPQSSGTAILIQSNWVNITGFTITNCGVDGIYLVARKHIRIEDNIISNNTNEGVDVNSNSDNVTIANNIIKNCRWGILFSGSNKDNLITNNKLSNHQVGIYFWSLNTKNSIVGNTISDNSASYYALEIANSNNNMIYHNNFVNNLFPARDNSNNQWDSGYPGGGNFWGNYNGTDRLQGPNQNIPGNDGIGDINISIPGGSNIDRYPVWPNWNTLEIYTPSPGPEEVTEYAMGSIKVGVIFVESNGSIDQETENWTSGRMSTVLSEIQAGLTWWEGLEPNASLSFSIVNLGIKNTSYEPIQNQHINESFWVNEIMANLGFITGNFLERVKGFSHQLRTIYNTDWAFTILVVDSDNDTDSFPGCYIDATLTNQWCAWAYMEYGYFTMTYDNDGWGISRMNNVSAHETGHMFYATDEYTIPNERSGYLNALESGYIAGHLMVDNTLNLSTGTMGQIGWRDSDADGILDILDTYPNTYLDPASGGATTDETPWISGAAVVVPFNNDNPNGKKNAVTLNTISYVQYRIDNTTWMNATATDGVFDEPVEYFNFKPGYLSPGPHFIEARAVNSVNNSDFTFANISINIIAGADTIYVDDDFVDNPSLHQWDTIIEGIADANPGDIVYVYSGVYNETVVVNKTINLTGESNTGTIIDAEGGSLPLWIDSTNVNVTNLSIFNSSGYCLNVTGSNVYMSNCRIFNNSGYGIMVRNSPEFNIIDCTIFNTSNTGLNIINSVNSAITNVSIMTTGISGRGMYVGNSNNSIIQDCRFNTTGSNAFGIHQYGNFVKIINTTINSSLTTDIYIVNMGTMVAIDCTFGFNDVDVEQDGGGVLLVKNYLTIQAYYQDGATPIPGADIEIIDNSSHVYASAGYGGSDSTTDGAGRAGPVLVQDRWYNYSNSPIENYTEVKVKKTINKAWEEVHSDVNMSSSHVEVFTATDITAPPKPMGLTITRVAGTNNLNISWNHNLDTHNYSVYYSVGGCSFIQIANVTHPQNWTLHLDLNDGEVYLYTIRAWDLVGLPSLYADPVLFNLTDITPPAIPLNLTAKPKTGGDELEISWDQNIDDTVNYELWWAESLIGPWNKLNNISHPTNFTTFSEPILVNGSTYYFKICAWDEVPLSSGYSAPASVVHIDYIAPSAPTGLMAVAESISNITITWSAPADVDVQGYQVFINQSGVGSGGPYNLQDEVDALSYQFIELMENTTYYFVIRAFDEAEHKSAFSGEAKNTTFGEPPGKPTLDILPKYTNEPKINITGTADKFVTVLVFNNGQAAGAGSADANGTFNIQITLAEDFNMIKSRARDQARVEGPLSEVQNITLDTQKPTTEAGDDLNIFSGQTVKFDASASTDNYGIVNYTWSFEDFQGEPVELYEVEAEYRFDYSGYFKVTLTVTDVAGNIGTDTLWVDVTTLPIEQPEITTTVPENNTVDVPVDIGVVITFSLPMDVDSVEDVLKVLPATAYNVYWNDDKTEMTIEFTQDLEYDTEYRISVGKAQAIAGGVLKDATFVLVFTTEKTIVPPTITITQQPGDTEVEPGKTITISGTATGVPEGTQVSVALGGEIVYDTIAADGSWSVNIRTPGSEGTYELTVTINDVTETGSVIIKKPTEPEDGDEDEDKGLLGFGPMMDYLIIFVIIIIIIIILALALRKKPVEEEEVEEEGIFEEEGLEEEEVAEEDIGDEAAPEGVAEGEEFECPDCGKALGADATRCTKCGAEFEEDTEAEDLEEEEPAEEELTKEQPEDEQLTEEEPVEDEDLEE
ncbi:NosD domain-containing protein [[Eubacterium] cellulosolvens]